MMNCRDTQREAHSRCKAIVDTHIKYNHKAQRIILEKYRETNDNKYKELLIKANYAFTYTVASKYARTSHHSVFDLFIEGNIGVGEAADKFDMTCDYHFITYAVWHIRKRILKYMIVNYGGLVSIGQISAKKDAEARRKGKESGVVLPSYASHVVKNGNTECIFDNMAQTTFSELDNYEEESTKSKVLNQVYSIYSTLSPLEKDILNRYYTQEVTVTELSELYKVGKNKVLSVVRELANRIKENVSNRMVVELGYDKKSRY